MTNGERPPGAVVRPPTTDQARPHLSPLRAMAVHHDADGEAAAAEVGDAAPAPIVREASQRGIGRVAPPRCFGFDAPMPQCPDVPIPTTGMAPTRARPLR